MKLLIALSALLTISAAEWTCDDCNAVVGTIGTYLASEDSIAVQVDILVAEVCPMTEHVDECVENLPAFWSRVAMVMWPGYYRPDATWMCAQEGLCGATATRTINCDECNEGIRMSIDQMLSDEFVGEIVQALSGDGFCGMEEEPERCANVIANLIPMALPILAAGFNTDTTGMICNMAIPDTCPAY